MRILAAFLLAAAGSAGLPAAAQNKDGEKKKEPPPKVLYSVPIALTPGVVQKVVLRGKNLDTAGLLVDSRQLTGKLVLKGGGGRKAAVPNNFPAERVGDTEFEFEYEPAAKSKFAVAAVGPGGTSEPYPLFVPDDGLPAVAEKEPNDGFDAAQPLTLPAAVVGTVHAERNPDVFRVEGKAGKKLRAEVQAARYGSPLDAVLTLTDADRRVVAAADGGKGGPDPVLTVTLPKDGRYFLSLIDANDLGGPTFGYRLVVREE